MQTIPFRILMIEDDLIFGQFLEQKIKSTLKDFNVHTTWAKNFDVAANALQTQNFETVLIDMNLHGKTVGLDLLKLSKEKNFYSIILTDLEDAETIRKAYEGGVDHYLTKDQFQDVMGFILKDHFEHLSYEASQTFDFNSYVTQDPYLKKDLEGLIKRLSEERPLLLLGESGVGKKKIAEIIHAKEKGPKKKLITLSLTGVNESDIESVLFGHIKGAYPGATDNKTGKLREARGGTLYIEEMAALPIKIQQKLLDVLTFGEFSPLGSDKSYSCDFRLIVASCQDVYQKIEAGRLRADFFQFVSRITVTIPPLRERKKDIPLLIEKFLKGHPRKMAFHADALEYMENYAWPGNVHELENVLEELQDKRSSVIYLNNLPYSILARKSSFQARPDVPFLTEEQTNFVKSYGFDPFIEKVELETIKEVLKEAHDHPGKANDILRMTRSTFYRLYKRHTDQMDEQRLSSKATSKKD